MHRNLLVKSSLSPLDIISGTAFIKLYFQLLIFTINSTKPGGRKLPTLFPHLDIKHFQFAHLLLLTTRTGSEQMFITNYNAKLKVQIR